MFAPYFFLSYARSDPLAGNPQENPDQLVGRFFRDLADAVQRLASRGEGRAAGFFDQALPAGSDWKLLFTQALSTTKVFVPLYSRGYLRNSWPGREFACFRRRVEQAGRANPSRWFVPVLWAPLAGIEDLPGLREALASGVTAEYAENGLRALLRLRPYRDVYEAEVRRLAEQIVAVAESDPLEPSQVEDIEHVQSEFSPGPPLAIFGIEVAAPTLATAPPGRELRAYGDTSIQWRPYAEQELPLAEYAREVIARFNFDVRVNEISVLGDPAQRRPGIVVIDPEFVADQAGRDTLGSAARQFPAWVLPVVVLDQPGDRRTRDLAAEVRKILTRARPLPTKPARQGARGVESLNEFVSIVPLLVAEAERQYVRYQSSRVPSSRPAGRLSLRQREGSDRPAEPRDRSGEE
jgi:FxsC-like protein